MRAFLIALLAAVPLQAAAQHAGHDDPHAGHQMSDPHAGHDMHDAPAQQPPAADALSEPAHAADTVFDRAEMEAARHGLLHETGDMRTWRVTIDRLEARLHEGRDLYLWDAEAWYGGDIDKLWLKTEGEGAFRGKVEAIETQTLWSHAVTPWFDLQAGLRYDFRPEPERGYLVLGARGLAPYFIEVHAAAFVSEKGDVSARLELEYDLLITQRLVLQPRGEVSVAVQQVRELGIGRGVGDVELGLRLRYEFEREIAPYIGVEWHRKIGNTADFARDEGESVDDLFFVAGIRLWF